MRSQLGAKTNQEIEGRRPSLPKRLWGEEAEGDVEGAGRSAQPPGPLLGEPRCSLPPASGSGVACHRLSLHLDPLGGAALGTHGRQAACGWPEGAQ